LDPQITRTLFVRPADVIARIRALFKKADTAKEPLDLSETIREVIDLIRNEIEKKQITLRLELARDLPLLVGDRVQLQQVLLNLILNGIEAMSRIHVPRRELTISTHIHRMRESWSKGAIPARDSLRRPLVFTCYFGDVKPIIPRYNRFRARSAPHFHTQFPMTDVSLISVVDDDESLRESLEGLLKSLGHLVAVFSSAESFLSSETLAKTDCLILDVRMPGMSGPELQRELISHQEKLPIIFITAHGDDDVISRVMADGAVDCLLKPFSEDSLLNAINLALSG
jgi:CheY-like chemotaxis protein